MELACVGGLCRWPVELVDYCSWWMGKPAVIPEVVIPALWWLNLPIVVGTSSGGYQ